MTVLVPKAMRKKTISGYLCFASFDVIRVSKFNFGLKINRVSVLEKFLRKSNKNNRKTKVRHHCTKIIILIFKNRKYQIYIHSFLASKYAFLALKWAFVAFKHALVALHCEFVAFKCTF